MGKKYGVSISWKRALGVSGAKNKISRKIGIPLTKQGRQRKVGNAMGCCLPVIMVLAIISCVVLLAMA